MFRRFLGKRFTKQPIKAIAPEKDYVEVESLAARLRRENILSKDESLMAFWHGECLTPELRIVKKTKND